VYTADGWPAAFGGTSTEVVGELLSGGGSVLDDTGSSVVDGTVLATTVVSGDSTVLTVAGTTVFSSPPRRAMVPIATRAMTAVPAAPARTAW
jgi:hypothetical protein